MQRSPSAPFALLLCLLAACQPRPMNQAPGDPAGTAAGGPLVSTLQAEASREGVRLSLQVTNASQATVTLQFNSGQRYDFAVRDGAREVWRWSADMGFTQALGSETLAPGETRTYAERWPADPALAGRTLTAVGRLTSRSHPVERTLEFRAP